MHCFDLILAGNYWQETIRALGFEDIPGFREYEYSVFRKDLLSVYIDSGT